MIPNYLLVQASLTEKYILHKKNNNPGFVNISGFNIRKDMITTGDFVYVRSHVPEKSNVSKYSGNYRYKLGENLLLFQ